MLIANQLLLTKTEVTYGTDAVPTASANATLTFPVDSSLDVAKLDYGVVRASISTAKDRLGRKMVNFTIKCPLKGSGTAGTPPEIGALIQACAHKQTISAGTSVSYKPASAEADMKSATIHFFCDGRARKATGCMGNFAIDMPPGGFPTITFTMRGKLASEGDASMPTGKVFQTTEPVVVESAGVSFGSFDEAEISAMSYDSQNQSVDRADVNSPDGIKGVSVTARNPQFKSTVKATVEATKAWYGNFIGRVEEAIDITIGTVAGNIVTIAIPKFCANEPMNPQSDNGMVTFGINGQALENAGDDNITLTFS